MEKCLSAVSKMYSQFEKREAHQMGEYIGRLANFHGNKMEVVGYNNNQLTDEPLLIVDASQIGGWSELGPSDVIFKDCEAYWYVGTKDLID